MRIRKTVTICEITTSAMTSIDTGHTNVLWGYSILA